MLSGLPATLKLLKSTKNEAARTVLEAALDHTQGPLQLDVLRALLGRRDLRTQKRLLLRWRVIPDAWKEAIRGYPGSLSGALRSAILDADRGVCDIGTEAILQLREYDLVPALINASEDEGNPNADLAAETLRRLILLFYNELAGIDEVSSACDLQRLRTYILTALESSVHRFSKHRCRQIVEAFLALVPRSNPTLSRILKDPHHGTYLSMIDILTHDRHPGVVRLLLGCLGDPQTPGSIVTVVGHRSDYYFLKHFLKRIGEDSSPAMAANLKRITGFAWLDADRSFFERFGDEQQAAAVLAVAQSGTNRLDAFDFVARMLVHGKPGGRLAAARALHEFQGAKANELILVALEDADPQVQAAVVPELRGRGIPGGLNRIISLLDSPHEVVRQAARENLPEFRLQNFLNSFELLDEEARRKTGQLVLKVDPDAMDLLINEMQGRVRGRVIRALQIVVIFQCAERLEPYLLSLIHDTDHVIRVAVARALAFCPTQKAYDALEEATLDRSPAVQEAALESLHALADLALKPADVVKDPAAMVLAEQLSSQREEGS